jgi:hypothetical protein
VASSKVDEGAGNESEGSFGIVDSDQSTPTVGRGAGSGEQLSRKAVERSIRARCRRSTPAGSETDDSVRDDAQTSE